jgi:hypothetical protein
MLFVSDLRKVVAFSTRTPVSFTNNTDRQDIIEILLKVALNLYTLAHKIVRSQKIQWQKEKKDKQTNNDLHNTT